MSAATWRSQAACLDMPDAEDVFFPASDVPSAYDRARAVCAGCPVAALCLADALAVEPRAKRYGMFGGKTPDERRALAAKCGDRAGTEEGYQRHRAAGERPCHACTGAHGAAIRYAS